MQTAWFLLAKSGELQATLLQGIPPRFAGGAYKIKEVDLASEVLPEVRLPEVRLPEVRLSQARPAGIDGSVASAAEAGTVLAEAPAGAPAEERAAWIDLEQGQRIIGQEPGFLEVLENAHKVAGYDVSVLIRGETGTGKELIARFIHERSNRAGAPFASVNCAAIGPVLAGSELFGHLKGAFTGADREITVDVRILAATNQDLERLIEKGSFRRDLYQRLNQVTLLLPPAIQAHFNREPVVREISADLPSDGLNLKALLFQIERQFYFKALEAAGGNREQAAKLLGLNAPAFRKALRERFGDQAEE